MVAPSGTMSDSESCSSSNSDAEELARCREAAMPAWGLQQLPQGAEKPRSDAAGKQVPVPSQRSLRREVNQHDEDGNELQTTPEFRAHVAKKLGAMLDSSIAISEVWKPHRAEEQQVTEEEGGFRLFFTSIPGSHKKEVSPKPRRKRQPPSSSSEDSDGECQRCREAAVSASDILQESAIHRPAEVQELEKRKLKKKAKEEMDIDLAGAAGLKQVEEAGSVIGDPAPLGVKKKKRKKKAKKAREASRAHPQSVSGWA
ncbi:protein CUSTOS isoform X2 [Phodopus roborovskii]|uniref:Protein CUSTOS n=1 Tax=Phodopus roborovskii TaxID=109678 RepID=A0AAU9YTU7_PHORO|nr:protein CUSTOS isoform X2 [Phodopus roborovskii]CAH6778781.1 2210016L21Rik [Phodopus roborovskii]